MFDSRLLSALLVGFALIPAVQAAQADAMPGAAPSFRIPRPLSANPPVFSAPTREPQAMLPPPDSSPYHASGSVSMQGGNPFDLNSKQRIFNFNAQQGNNAAEFNSAAPFRKPDQYSDSPQVDADGVRHFSNGRHFDLSKTTIQDAIGQTNSSQLGQRKKQLNAPGGQPNPVVRNDRRQDFLSRRIMNGNPYDSMTFDPRNNSYDYSNYHSQSHQPVVTDWRNTSDAAQNNRNYSMQQSFGNSYQQGNQQYNQLNDYDRQQRRAMRRQARQMQMRNYNF